MDYVTTKDAKKSIDGRTKEVKKHNDKCYLILVRCAHEKHRENNCSIQIYRTTALFLNLLPGATAYTGNYYPVGNSIKQMNENDLLRKNISKTMGWLI